MSGNCYTVYAKEMAENIFYYDMLQWWKLDYFN